MNLGAALASVGRGTEAAAVLRAGASLDGSGLKDRRAHEAARVQALLQLGALYADQGRLQRALSAYREALHALPDHYPPQVRKIDCILHCKSNEFLLPFCSTVFFFNLMVLFFRFKVVKI